MSAANPDAPTIAEPGPLASALLSAWKSLDRDALASQSGYLSLLERALATASDLEQKLAANQNRIAYLESLSMTDDLTRLHNRRGFQDHLQRAIGAARRYDERGVVALLDLDSLKRINDACGHAAGDAALLKVAELLRSSLRGTDCIARLGGDEFAALMLRCETGPARQRLQRMRAAIDQTTIEVDGCRVHLAASLGIATFGPESDLADVMRAADQAMYADKRSRAVRASSRRSA
jgi:diguanylate cyclase (GGDEF)-like protein